MTSKYTLYGAPLSLYTGKARAYLLYKNQPFKEVFSSLKVYKKEIIPNTGVRFIPVVKTPQGQYLQDTVSIIEHIEAEHPERPVVPTTAKQKLASYLFEIWADEWLVIPAMHYRWNKDNFPFIYQEFGKVVVPNMPAFVRTFVGKKLGAKFKGFVPLLGITDKSIPAIEDWYENHVLRHLDEHFAVYDYLLGSKPCTGDFSLMGPLYAHLYRDPAPGNIMKRIAPNVAKWVERMSHIKEEEGEFLAGDQLPDTLLPLIERMFKEQWPVLQNTVVELENWANINPDAKDIPRVIGEHKFTIGNTTEIRAIVAFHQWKMQRVLECYNQFDLEERKELEEYLGKTGGLDFMKININRPVTRVKNRLLFLADATQK